MLLFLTYLVLSCVTEPKTGQNADQAAAETGRQTQDNAGGAFDPLSISEEVYAAAMADIQALIEDLNGIIRGRNYNAWLLHLSDSYLELINSPGFLGERTEELYRRDQIVAQNMGRDPRLVEKRVLRSSRDYFTNVVVPSRSNDRVDDIDFLSVNNVKAYTFDLRGQRLVLYNLAEIDGKWKIID